ncbi:hypothetical protein FH972_003928 [Carpinus fangiana]|uniref:Uncharacterized protein n=1 Tax=Carpinus fangiana TaxID=176857 RepID=A0A5N6QJK1_9ROSI|nr:hypothetical protein FH972_003928 [Carpinus fangiana]
MSSSTTGSGGPHILAYPYSDSGHIIPLLDLTHRLLARGLTVTVLVTPDSLPLLQPLLSTHPSSIQPLVLSVPPGKTRVAKVNAMSQLYYPILLQWFRSHPSPPVAIISDYFLGWTHHLACELGVRRLVFSPSGAFGFSVLLSLWRDLPKLDMGSPLSFPQIPHSPVFPWRQISHYYRNGKQGDPDWESNRTNILDDIASWGVVFNSFAEFERVYLEHMRAELGHDRVWAVGPLLPPEESEDSVVGPANRGGPSLLPCHEVMTWLGARHDSSVVYVCFGSRFSLPREQMDALAEALERSGVQFILAGEDTENIPESTELARLLAESVNPTRPERVRVKKLRDAALNAIKGGSSDKDLDDLLKRLSDA